MNTLGVFWQFEAFASFMSWMFKKGWKALTPDDWQEAITTFVRGWYDWLFSAESLKLAAREIFNQLMPWLELFLPGDFYDYVAEFPLFLARPEVAALGRVSFYIVDQFFVARILFGLLAGWLGLQLVYLIIRVAMRVKQVVWAS